MPFVQHGDLRRLGYNPGGGGGEISEGFAIKYYTVNSGVQTDSMVHAGEDEFSVGQEIQTVIWSDGYPSVSGGNFKVLSIRDTEYVGSLGGLTYTSGANLIVEGLWHRFIVIADTGSIMDIRKLGIQCVETVTGWHSRFETIGNWARANSITLTGSGTLSCTETVDLTRVFFHGETLRFQGGIAALNAATVAPPTFFTATYTNREVTFTTGTPVEVNLTAHGLISGDSFMFGVSHGGRLPGTLAFLNTYYVKDVLDADRFTISSTNGAAAIAATTPYTGTYYLFQGGTQNNIETVDTVLWSGRIVRKGVIVKAGGLGGAIRDHMTQRILVRGDGNSDWTTPPSTIGVLHCGDRGPNGYYRYTSNYNYWACGTNTENEKHEVHVTSTYSRYVWGDFKPTIGTPDSLDVFLSMANYQFAVYESPGLDSYIKYTTRAEPRLDPAADPGNEAGDDAPCFFFQNGKQTVLTGFMRGHNGQRLMYCTPSTSATGTTSRAWMDSLVLDDYTIIGGYGCVLDLNGVRRVSGRLHVRDWNDANGVGQPAGPAFRIGRVSNAAGLRVFATNVKNTLGLEIGSSSNYSRDAHLGYWSIDMGDLAQFSSSATELPGASGNPTTLDSWSFVKGKNCQIDLSGCRGKGTIGADVTENCKIILDSNARDYTLTTTTGMVATADTGSSAKPREVAASGAVTVSHLDDIIIVNKTVGAATTVNLPSIPLKGRVYTIKDGKGDANANNITITQPITVTNGTFASDTAWTKGTGWTIAAGVASSDGSQSGNSDLSQSLTGLTPGASYSVAYTVTAYTAGNIRVVLGGTAGTNRASAATFTETLVAGTDGTIIFRADLDFIGSIDNVTVTGLIDGATTSVMNVNYQALSLAYNGKQFNVL